MSYHLIADDNELNRMVIKILLEKNKFNVDEVENGQQVIDKLTSNLTKYSFIWLDVDMPELDGIQCAKKLKNELKYDEIIIGITGHVDDDSLSACIEAGMDCVLAKPISEENLIETVEQFTKNQL